MHRLENVSQLQEIKTDNRGGQDRELQRRDNNNTNIKNYKRKKGVSKCADMYVCFNKNDINMFLLFFCYYNEFLTNHTIRRKDCQQEDKLFLVQHCTKMDESTHRLQYVSQ